MRMSSSPMVARNSDVNIRTEPVAPIDSQSGRSSKMEPTPTSCQRKSGPRSRFIGAVERPYPDQSLGRCSTLIPLRIGTSDRSGPLHIALIWRWLLDVAVGAPAGSRAFRRSCRLCGS